MFRFEDSSLFYLLAFIPIMLITYIWSNKRLKQRIKLFGNAGLVQRLISGNKGKYGLLQYVIFNVALIFIIFALVNPQSGLKKEKSKVENSDIFIALDISSSMNTTDISPSRLEKAKKLAESLIETRKGDQIGLILFAGGAYLQMPLTSDYAAAKLFTMSANSEMAGTQGTAIGDAIDLAIRSAGKTGKTQKALIIITDGEDHDTDAVSKAESAASEGLSIFTIGVGTPEGGLVPVMNDGREEYKTDEEGNPVRSVLNTTLINELAEKGNGSSFMIEDKDIIPKINMQIEKLQKRTMEVQSFTEYKSYYQYFLTAGLILILTGFFVNYKYEV